MLNSAVVWEPEPVTVVTVFQFTAFAGAGKEAAMRAADIITHRNAADLFCITRSPL
jgi:hypothetical protein